MLRQRNTIWKLRGFKQYRGHASGASPSGHKASSESIRKDEKVEETSSKRGNRGVRWVLDPDAGDYSEKHHRGQPTGRQQQDRAIEMSQDDGQARGNLQCSREHAKTGEPEPFKLPDHLLGE